MRLRDTLFGGNMPDPLTSMPDTVRLGDTLSVKFSLADFPADDGWTATVYWIGVLTDYSKATTASGSDHLLSLTPTETNDNLNVEQMQWNIQVVKGTDKYTPDNGTQDGLVNFSTAAAQDLRSSNQKVLDAIVATIENRASLDQQEYTIKDRQLKRMTIEELLKFQSIYEARVASDKRKEKGQGTPLVKVRFNRP